MYNDNPTLEGITKHVDETKQGEVFFTEGKKGDKHFYIESYGCQMNFSDSEIVASILGEAGYQPTRNMEIADLTPVPSGKRQRILCANACVFSIK